MVTNNAIDLSASGMVSYNGTGTFAGRTLTAGNGSITITNGDGISGNPTFTATGGGFPWTDVTGTSQAMSVDNGYIADNAGLVTLTLPSASASIGATIIIMGKGAGGWIIAQNAGQQIHVGNVASTAGVTGSVASTNQWDNIELICVTAGASSIWSARPPEGNLTIA